MQLIDTHCHLGSDDPAAYPRADAKPIETDEYVNTAEQFIALMDEAGVAGACAVQALGLYGYDNSYHADAGALFPMRYAGICGMSCEQPDAPALLRFWVGERGMSGVRLSYWGPGAPLDPEEPKLTALLKEADQLGVAVCFLTTRKHLAPIKELARRFAGLRFAVDHLGVALGEPDRVRADLFALAEAKNIFLKFSTPILASEPHQDFFKEVVDCFGPNRLMWGSDFPHTNMGGYKAMVDLARRALAPYSESDRAAMFGGNAVGVWPGLRQARAKA